MLFLAFMYVNDRGHEMSYSNPDLNDKLYYSGIYCSFILAYLKSSDPRAVLFFYFIFIFALHDCGFIIFHKIQSFSPRYSSVLIQENPNIFIAGEE